jgi:hypothetical protein
MSLNLRLKDALQEEFEPRGIVAYSGCCRWGCTGSYDEDSESFESRNKGIYYIRFHLSGMNYSETVESCAVSYCDTENQGNAFAYLMDNWNAEVQVLQRFFEILGLQENQYRIVKPESARTAIMLYFNDPYQLEALPEDSDDEAMSGLT